MESVEEGLASALAPDRTRCEDAAAAPARREVASDPLRRRFSPARALAFGAVAAGLAVIALAALNLTAGADFDYAAASEAEQQRILDEMAAGLEYGIARATGGALKALATEADAAADRLSLDAQFVDSRFEAATEEHVAVFSRKMYADNCNFFMTRKVVAAGVSVRYRIARPSGRPLADFVFDRETCAPYLRAAVG
jgi:hypothetical protein